MMKDKDKIKSRIKKAKPLIGLKEAFDHGKEKGSEMRLTQGLDADINLTKELVQ